MKVIAYCQYGANVELFFYSTSVFSLKIDYVCGGVR